MLCDVMLGIICRRMTLESKAELLGRPVAYVKELSKLVHVHDTLILCVRGQN